GKWFTCARALVLGKGLQPTLARYPLALVVENDGVTIERDPQLVMPVLRRLGRQQRGRRDPRCQRAAYVLCMGGQEQVGTERADVRKGRSAITERGTPDRGAVVGDGIEDAQPGVGRVARDQDHLDPR